MGYRIIPSPVGDPAAYTRPLAWLTKATPAAEEVHLLVFVWPGVTNRVRLDFEGPSGYHVDWGDGSAEEDVATGVNADHEYDFTDLDASTLMADGTRQARIIVTAQSSSTLTRIELGKADAEGSTVSLIREVVANTPSLLAMIFNTGDGIERVEFVGTLAACTSVQGFDGLYTLQRLILPDLPSITVLGGFVRDCHSLLEVTLGECVGVTSMYQAFTRCYSLRKVTMGAMAACTNCTDLFWECYALEEWPTGLTLGGAFSGGQLVRACYSLRSIPATADFSNATYLWYAFADTRSLESFGPTDLGANTDLTFGFAGSAIRKLGDLDLSLCAAWTTTFALANSLASIGAMRLDAADATIAVAFANTPSLQTCGVTGLAQTCSFADSSLDHAALVILFGNLATVVGKTLTVSANPGWGALSAGEKAVATGKGWTLA